MFLQLTVLGDGDGDLRAFPVMGGVGKTLLKLLKLRLKPREFTFDNGDFFLQWPPTSGGGYKGRAYAF